DVLLKDFSAQERAATTTIEAPVRALQWIRDAGVITPGGEVVVSSLKDVARMQETTMRARIGRLAGVTLHEKDKAQLTRWSAEHCRDASPGWDTELQGTWVGEANPLAALSAVFGMPLRVVSEYLEDGNLLRLRVGEEWVGVVGRDSVAAT